MLSAGPRFTTQTVTVGSGARADRVLHLRRRDPAINQPVNFNGTRLDRRGRPHDRELRLGLRRRQSAVTNGTPVASHAYGVARTYTVTLTVTDDIGRTNTTSRTIPVTP